VWDAFFEIATLGRDLFDRRRAKMASRLAGMTEIGDIVAAIADEDRKLMEAMADTFTRLAETGLGGAPAVTDAAA